jgi:hypothetical protein
MIVVGPEIIVVGAEMIVAEMTVVDQMDLD